jgi:hypothetical protein
MAQVGFFSFVFVDDLFNVLLKTYTNKLLLSTRSITWYTRCRTIIEE